MPQAALLEPTLPIVSEPHRSGRLTRIAEGLALAQHEACWTTVVARCVVVDGLRGVGARWPKARTQPTQETLDGFTRSIVPVTPVTPKRRDKSVVVSHRCVTPEGVTKSRCVTPVTPVTPEGGL